MFDHFKTSEVKKGIVLLSKGQPCKVAFQVISGCLKSYVIDEKGKEHILQFAPENWIISDLDSVINNKPSKIFIEAIEHSSVYLLPTELMINKESLNREELIKLLDKSQNNMISNTNRLISLLSSSSEERYQEFLETYPQLAQRLPQKLIASYLGMTPEHLSHIRGKYTK